ncbi:hypothetical protein EIL87_25670 [Saccharopolyspora rhizosphaerae]|uniref:Uncharacterized protein n=1 Tax=Saccharopolyspora rhizosphaerae TaxID=2492662 RepID=A0A426JIM7_9PSEU|nr:hypothetical protein [Saccharopolyspora rhizosphaerae]RRO13044.1 hypothetical protein EIL87_25670 [Saccharopolyspora rhizosphaerae]
MAEIWLQVLVAVLAGCTGAGVALAVRRSRGGPAREQSQEPEPLPQHEPDVWEPFVQHCEQAVLRASRAVEAMSSQQARNSLQTVVRRMDAELPTLRVFAELGRGLGDTPRDAEIARRVRAELAHAERLFAEITGEVLSLVGGLDPERVQALRARFPLLHPLSAVLPEPVS